MAERRGQEDVAITDDGETWHFVRSTAPAPSLERRQLISVGGGFVLVGGRRTGDGLSTVFWSSDGESWAEIDAFGDRAHNVADARIAAVGRGGAVIEARTKLSPGPVWWFATTDGRNWRFVEHLAPLGRWTTDRTPGEWPAGQLAGDGNRMVAYDTVDGSGGWTSFDGQTWTELDISGDEPPWFHLPNKNLVLLPDGLVWRDATGDSWFGEAVGLAD